LIIFYVILLALNRYSQYGPVETSHDLYLASINQLGGWVLIPLPIHRAGGKSIG